MNPNFERHNQGNITKPQEMQEPTAKNEGKNIKFDKIVFGSKEKMKALINKIKFSWTR